MGKEGGKGRALADLEFSDDGDDHGGRDVLMAMMSDDDLHKQHPP